VILVRDLLIRRLQPVVVRLGKTCAAYVVVVVIVVVDDNNFAHYLFNSIIRFVLTSPFKELLDTHRLYFQSRLFPFKCPQQTVIVSILVADSCYRRELDSA
jgi:hypothetical protein